MQAQWAAEDAAEQEALVQARLAQQRLNAEVTDFNRWAYTSDKDVVAAPGTIT